MGKGYDRWGLYHDAADPRLWVPKTDPAMGWTVNVAHRHGPRVLGALAVVIAGALLGALVMALVG